MMRPVIENVVATIRSSAAARWSSVRDLRVQTRVALADRRARRQASARGVREALYRHRASAVAAIRRVVTAHAPVAEPPRSSLDPWLEAAVLRVVVNHPEGVRALDIGNELGIDWRRVPGVATKLAAAGLIDQVEQEFYPAGKASPR